MAVESSISPGQAGGGDDGEGTGREAFGPSRACFEELITTLADPEGGRLTHAQLEEQLAMLSRDLVRTLHQDSLVVRLRWPTFPRYGADPGRRNWGSQRSLPSATFTPPASVDRLASKTLDSPLTWSGRP